MPLLDDSEVMEYFAFFLNDFTNGRLPDVLKNYLLPARLLALKKENSNKPRPVAVGELFYRIVTSWSVESLGETARDILAPIQLGIGERGGVEKASIFIQALLTDDNLKYPGVATDISNAYNNRERKTMLDALYAEHPLQKVWRLADWAYTTQHLFG